MLQAALDYAAAGYAVGPVVNKVPVLPHGVHDFSSDPAKVESYFAAHPQAGIGLSAAGLLIVDIDGPHNAWPNEPEKARDLAAAPTSRTPSGGRHHFFRKPAGKTWRCSAGKLAPYVDTRSDGGYVVAPPMAGYEWIVELDRPADQLPEPPAWLCAELDAIVRPAVTAVAGEPGGVIPVGQRNATLTSWAGSWRRRGAGSDLILDWLRVLNRQCKVPLPDDDLVTIAKSVCRYAPGEIVAIEPAEPAPKVYDPGQFPERLLNVPGFIGEVMTYNLATAPRPQPVLALAGAITLQSVLAGRKVRDSRDNRTNLYAIGVAGSGEGKEWSRKVTRRIMYHAGLEALLGPEDLASDAGLVTAVVEQPAILFQVDEIGRLLRTVCNPQSAPHLYNIVTALMRMYSVSDTAFVGKAYADSKRNVVIHQPCVSLFGTTTPGSFFDSLTAESIADGFLARLLIFETAGHTSRQRKAVTDPPQTIIDAARWWGDFLPGAGNLRAEHPTPHLIPATAEAEQVFDDLAERVDNELVKGHGKALWARAEERACRLALVYACSADRLNLTIDEAAARWACELSIYQTERMLALADRWVSENRIESNHKRVERIIAAAGSDGMAKADLWHYTRWLKRSERDEILSTLIETGGVQLREVPTGGRPRQCYVATAL